jgi:hypothetical protein
VPLKINENARRFHRNRPTWTVPTRVALVLCAALVTDVACPENLAAGSSCTVRVRFVPTTVGASLATLAIWAAGGGGTRSSR